MPTDQERVLPSSGPLMPISGGLISEPISRCSPFLMVASIYDVLWVRSEKAMTPHSGTLAWKIPWTEEPGRLQSMGLQRVRHDWATSLSLFTFLHWRRKWQPTPVFLPGESQGWGSLVSAVYGVTQSRTRLKWLSSSSSMGALSPKYFLNASSHHLHCI